MYETTWGFKSISPNINMDNNFKDTLKKALIVNGENGTCLQVQNIVLSRQM